MKSAPDIFHANGFGKVAPWVDLVNSEEWDGFGKLTDQLANPRWLATFLKHWDLYPLPSKGLPRPKLVKLRNLLRRAAEKLGVGGSLSRREISKLNQALNVPVWQKLIQNQNGFRTETVPVRSDWDWVQARIAASFGEMLERPHLRQPRARPPCPGRTKAKSLTKKFLLSSGPRLNLLIGSQELFRRTSAKNSSRVCLL